MSDEVKMGDFITEIDGIKYYSNGYQNSSTGIFVTASVAYMDFSVGYQHDVDDGVSSGGWTTDVAPVLRTHGKVGANISYNADGTLSVVGKVGKFELGVIQFADGKSGVVAGAGIGTDLLGLGVQVFAASRGNYGNLSTYDVVYVRPDGVIVTTEHKPGDHQYPHVRVDITEHHPDGTTEKYSTNIADPQSAADMGAGIAPHMSDNCFPAGTLIDMWDGSRKDIKDIRPLDEVLTRGEDGNPAKGIVDKTFTNAANELIHLSFDDGRDDLYTTPGHHFLSETGEYVQIGQMVKLSGALNGGRVRLVDASGEMVTASAEHLVYSSETAGLFASVAVRTTTYCDGNTVRQLEAPEGWQTHNFEVRNTHNYVAHGIQVHNLSEIILPTGNDYTNNALVEMLESMGILDERQEELTIVKDGDQIVAILVKEGAKITHADGTVTGLSDFVDMLQEGARALADAVGDTLGNIPGYIQSFAPGIIADLVMGGDLEAVAEQYAIQIATTMGIDTLAHLFGLEADQIGYTMVDGRKMPVFDGVGLFDTEAGQAIKGAIVQFAVVAALRGGDMDGSDYAKLAANASIRSAISYVVKNHAGEWAANTIPSAIAADTGEVVLSKSLTLAGANWPKAA